MTRPPRCVRVLARGLACAALVVLPGCAAAPAGAANTPDPTGPTPAATTPAPAPSATRTTPAPTSPARTTASLTAALTSVSPQIATPTTDVVVSLVVRNAGTAPLTAVTATATLGGRRFAERGEVGRWLSSPAESGGAALATVASAPLATLAPGASATLAVTIPRTAWRVGRPFADVPVDLAVRTASGAAARTRTVVPCLSATPEYVPLQLAWVAPLTAPADPALFSSAGAPTLSAWRSAIGPGSVVRERLAAAGATPVTWFVDPTLVEAQRYAAGATAARTPTTTAQRDAAARGSAAGALVADLVTDLRALPATQAVWSLPPGDPDTAALLGGDTPPEELYPQGASPLDTALGMTLPRATAWPADGVWSSSREAAWPGASRGYPMTSALVSSQSLAAQAGYTPEAVNRSAQGTGLLAYDEQLSDIAGGTAAGVAGDSRAQVVQRFLAESLVLLGEREGTTRGTVVALPRTASVDPATLRALWQATGSAPWLRTTTLPALAAQLPTAPVTATRAPGTTLEPASPLTAPAVQSVAQDRRRLDGLRAVLPAERSAYSTVWSGADAQLLSARWRASNTGWSVLRRRVDAAVTSTTDAVQVAPATVNFLADAGAVAITVTNDLPYPVTGVRLRLTPGNTKLRVDAQPAPVTIQARSRATVRVDVTALGSGEVPVVAALTTPDGTPLGSARTVRMNVRPPAEWILYVVGVVTALVLVGGLVRTLTRKPTRAARDDLAPPAATPEPSPRGER